MNEQLDAIALLKADHRKVEDLFTQFEKAQRKDQKQKLANEICLELTIHTRIEEAVFYPACRGEIDSQLWHEAVVEHDSAKILVAEIEAGNPDDEYYDAKVSVLAEQVRAHFQEEEKRGEGLFDQAREAGLDLEDLGHRLQVEKERLFAEYRNEGLPVPPTPSLFDTRLAHHGARVMPAGASLFSLYSPGSMPKH